MSIPIPGQLLVFHAPEPVTPAMARHLGAVFTDLAKRRLPLVLDPGWRIEQIPIRTRKRIRLANVERWLAA